METSPDLTAAPSPARIHTDLGLSIFLIVAGLCAILDFLAHDPGFTSWSRAQRWAEAQRSKHIFMPVGHMKDDGDRVVNEELAWTDHTGGGIVLLGTSNLTWALKPWELPERQRALIHNYGIQGTSHSSQFKLLRFLVEKEGLLSAGPEKALVIFAAGYQNVGFYDDPTASFSHLLRLRGFFTRNPDGTVQRSSIGPVFKTLSIERARVYGVADELMRMAYYAARDAIGKPRRLVFDRDGVLRVRAQLLGPDSESKIRRELKNLIEAIDYLKARKVPTLIVLMPQGSWEEGYPFDRTYAEIVFDACRSRGVKIADFRKLFDDQDFADSCHFTTTGMDKFQAALMPYCLDHLRSTGLLTTEKESGTAH